MNIRQLLDAKSEEGVERFRESTGGKVEVSAFPTLVFRVLHPPIYSNREAPAQLGEPRETLDEAKQDFSGLQKKAMDSTADNVFKVLEQAQGRNQDHNGLSVYGWLESGISLGTDYGGKSYQAYVKLMIDSFAYGPEVEFANVRLVNGPIRPSEGKEADPIDLRSKVEGRWWDRPEMYCRGGDQAGEPGAATELLQLYRQVDTVAPGLIRTWLKDDGNLGYDGGQQTIIGNVAVQTERKYEKHPAKEQFKPVVELRVTADRAVTLTGNS